MGDNTHTLTVNRPNENSDSGVVTVPAQVQREQGITIDDTVEVTIHSLDGVISSVSFENEQTAGDRVTVPAEVARKVDLSYGSQYPISFEKTDDGNVALADSVGALEDLDDELEEIVEDAKIDEESESSDSDQEEEEEPGIGELFA